MNLKWISVKDRLPEKNDRYLCYDDNQGYSQVFEWYKNFNLNEWDWFDVVNQDFHVTHWMPLPEFPQAEDKTEIKSKLNDFVNSQEPMPPEFQKIVDENFWDLV
jgi:hypothetical protein